MSTTATLPAAAPARAWLSYGWVNVGVAALAMAATYPGRTQGLGMVTEPLLTDLGLGRTFYADLNLWATLIGAAFCLPVGGWVDRFGSRLVLGWNLLALGLAVLWMSTVDNWVSLAVALVLTRGLGQSALSVVSITLVAKWFTARSLGLAMAVYSVLTGFAFTGAIQLMSLLLVGLELDWRAAWAALGGVLLCGVLPLSVLLARSTPEEATPAEATPAGPLEGVPLAEALRSPAFWVFSLAVSFYGLIAAGIALFNESIFAERGFDRTAFHGALTVTTVTGVGSKFLAGWLAGRWPVGRLLGVALLLLTAALLALPLVRELWQVYLYAVAMGLAGGVVALVFFAVWGQTFGRRDVGRIQGIAQMLTVLASAFGPRLFAGVFEWYGSYTPAFQMLAPVAVALAAACCWVRPPAFGVTERVVQSPSPDDTRVANAPTGETA